MWFHRYFGILVQCTSPINPIFLYGVFRISSSLWGEIITDSDRHNFVEKIETKVCQSIFSIFLLRELKSFPFECQRKWSRNPQLSKLEKWKQNRWLLFLYFWIYGCTDAEYSLIIFLSHASSPRQLKDAVLKKMICMTVIIIFLSMQWSQIVYYHINIQTASALLFNTNVYYHPI